MNKKIKAKNNGIMKLQCIEDFSDGALVICEVGKDVPLAMWEKK